MAQSSYEVNVADQSAANDLVAAASQLSGVKWVNVNLDKGTVVVTHGDDFDEDGFKALVDG